MKNIRIILIAFLTIAISNMALSYLRHKLNFVHIKESKSFNHLLFISPSGLTDELDNDPACVQKSKIVSASGMFGKNESSYLTGSIISQIIDAGGLPIVFSESETHPGTIEIYDREDKALLGYWGAEGFSSDDISAVGQFSKDIIMADFMFSQYLYDQQTKMLYKLKPGKDKDQNLVLTAYPGLTIPESLDLYHQIADTYISATPEYLKDNFGIVACRLIPPAKFATEEEMYNINNIYMGKLDEIDGKTLIGINSDTTTYGYWNLNSNLVHLVDHSGEIYLADFDTGKVEKLNIGERIDIDTLCRDNYLYLFSPIYKFVYDRPKTGNEKTDADIKIISEEIIGYVEYRLSRTGGLTVDVYDTKGKKLGHNSESGIEYFDEKTANLLHARNFIETLPGILPVTLSYLTRNWFTPFETWQTLFLMPDSVANYAALTSGSETGILAYMEYASFSIYITIGLLIWYAVSVKKYGLSNRQRRFWAYLILLFGPAAFLAYTIARPKIVQVTCPNCGKLRRPDQNNCHNCRAGWILPQFKEVQWQIK